MDQSVFVLFSDHHESKRKRNQITSCHVILSLKLFSVVHDKDGNMSNSNMIITINILMIYGRRRRNRVLKCLMIPSSLIRSISETIWPVLGLCCSSQKLNGPSSLCYSTLWLHFPPCIIIRLPDQAYCQIKLIVSLRAEIPTWELGPQIQTFSEIPKEINMIEYGLDEVGTHRLGWNFHQQKHLKSQKLQAAPTPPQNILLRKQAINNTWVQYLILHLQASFSITEPPFNEDLDTPSPLFLYALQDLVASYSPFIHAQFITHNLSPSIIKGASSRGVYSMLFTLSIHATNC
ncbi:hypothetical protein SADUNF_Sadunf07G0110000 [Salix dunnii]|uniref:Uncharacterized protein n=1 Tax=Salix dunnii TaxID=1413687 RepID=A0A835K257_9ROSI|nr:hypothetical protein SADUNF_Sadunf07G0110000 [Salix dunnii]